MTKIKSTDLLHVFDDSAGQLGIRFYPETDRTFYLKDPYQDDFYVSLDDYYDYLKKASVSELEMVAQKLGAKRVRIEFKEHKKTFVSENVKAAANAKKINIHSSYDKTDRTFSSVEIAADVKFSGHNSPDVPQLVYFKNENDINKLIEMRINASNENKIESKTYRLECSKSSGIREKTTAEIDAVLGQLKCSGTASISSEAQRENRTILEYSIEF